jgi:hypothetical protein
MALKRNFSRVKGMQSNLPSSSIPLTKRYPAPWSVSPSQRCFDNGHNPFPVVFSKFIGILIDSSMAGCITQSIVTINLYKKHKNLIYNMVKIGPSLWKDASSREIKSRFFRGRWKHLRIKLESPNSKLKKQKGAGQVGFHGGRDLITCSWCYQ